MTAGRGEVTAGPWHRAMEGRAGSKGHWLSVQSPTMPLPSRTTYPLPRTPGHSPRMPLPQVPEAEIACGSERLTHKPWLHSGLAEGTITVQHAQALIASHPAS